MRKPLVLVTGVHPDPMASAVMAMQWDLPHAVVVHHRIDAERSVLHRVVSDVTGVLEREEIDLAHACVSCAIREDVVPTLHRLSHDARWGSVIAHLPVTAEAEQVCRVLAGDHHLARSIRVTCVVAALDGPGLAEDLVGDDLLCERGRAVSPGDRRGVGEVAASMVELADLVVLSGTPDRAGRDLVRLLARPDARVVTGTELLDPPTVVTTSHDLGRSLAWTDPRRTGDLPPVAVEHAWRVDLRSDRAFHPDRLLEQLERLGGGRQRSRGCFWLPTRPGEAVVWEGAGGQVGVGLGEPWGGVRPHTRLVVVGTHTPPDHLHEAFTSALLRPGEAVATRLHDGLEPWLGPVRDVA